MLIFPQNL